MTLTLWSLIVVVKLLPLCGLFTDGFYECSGLVLVVLVGGCTSLDVLNCRVFSDNGISLIRFHVFKPTINKSSLAPAAAAMHPIRSG